LEPKQLPARCSPGKIGTKKTSRQIQNIKAGKIGTKNKPPAKWSDVVAGKIITKTTSRQMQPWKNRNQNKLPARYKT
jgi:hypothetical protein